MFTIFGILGYIVLLGVSKSSANHFYGGTVTLVPDGSQQSVYLRYHFVGTSCSQCSPCTDESTKGWHTCITSSTTTASTYSYASTSWGGGWSGAGNWNLQASIYTATRSNGLHNYPPVTNTIPVVALQQSCSYAIGIAAYDVDGDDIKCRFATGTECQSACDKLNGATLDSQTCTLSYTPSTTGTLPVTIQVEDFYSPSSSSSSALSSIPLQFVVNVRSFVRACNTLPEIVTPVHKAVYTLATNTQFSLNVTARSEYTMSSIQAIRPTGLTTSSPTTWSSSVYSYMSMNAIWTPSSSDERAHVMCFIAYDIDSGEEVPSKQTCVILFVTSIGSLSSEPTYAPQRTYVRQISTLGKVTLQAQPHTVSLIYCVNGVFWIASYTSSGLLLVQLTTFWTTLETSPFKDCGGTINTITHGSATAPSVTTHGSTAMVTCDHGYENASPATVTCQSNGGWSTSSCSIKDCSGTINTITHGSATAPSVTTYGSTALVTCDTGYENPSPATVTCQSSGSWSTSSCSIKDCPSLTNPSDGTVSATNTQYGGVAIYACNSGYVIAGTNSVVTTSVTCLADGTWSKSAPTCSRRPNTRFKQSPAEEASTIQYIQDCAVLIKNGMNNNKLKMDNSKTELTNPTNGIVNAPNTQYECVATYRCHNGTGTSSDTTTRTCQAGGTWSGSVTTCSRINCESILSNVVTAGTATLISGTTYESLASVNCNAGYETTTTQLTCQADGQWSKSICTIKDCGSNPSSAVTDGTATPSSGTTYLSTATVTCNTGYETPTNQVTCQASGQWSTSVCIIKNCGSPSAQPNGYVSFTTTTYGSVATYSCNTGYIISGTVSDTTTDVTCLASGDWSVSNPNPTCDVKKDPLGATCPDPSTTNLSPGDLCTGDNAECLGRDASSQDFTCQCVTGYYDDNGNTAAGSCRSTSELVVQSISFSSVTTSAMNVTWLPPAGRENFVSEYEVTWRLTSTSADNGGGSSILSSTSVTISPGNLISGRAYTVTVTSRNSVDYTSRIQISSGQKEQALKPQTPGNIDYQSSNLDARDQTIQVVWIPSVGYVHQYEIELFEGNTQLATSTSSSIAYNQMKNGYRYNISITAVSEMFEGPNVVRSDPHTEEVKTVVQVPSSPGSVRCHTPTSASLTVQWDAPLLPNGDLLAYNISIYTYPTSTLVKTETTGDLDLDFTVISLPPGFYYFFFVSTVNEQYQSAPARLTETYCATQAGVSDAPHNLAASVTQSRSFTVTWTEPTETHGEQFGYVMQVRTLNDQNLNICVLEVIRRCSDCVQTFTTSSLFNMCPADVSTEELVTQASLTGDVTQTDTVTSLDPDKEYSASVTAVNAAGRGDVAEILVQTEEEVPQKPYNIAISGITTESCTVAWDIDGPRPGDTTFFVIVNPTAPVTYDMIGLPGFEERTQSLNGLQAYWTYTVIIRATTSKGSTESEPTPFTTLPSAPGPVAAFEIITASPGEDYTKLKVTWKMPELLQRNSEIKEYILNHNTSENTMMTLDQNEDTTYTYQVELDVIPEDTYKISVYAVNEEDQNGEEVGASITAPIADCGGLADPINGVVVESDTQFEDIATYECDAGYVITGTTDPLFDRTCQVDGSWSGSAPTCSRREDPLGATCPDPSTTNLSPGDLCTGDNAECLGRDASSQDFTCQCVTGYYDDNGNTAAGSCRSTSELVVQSISFSSVTTSAMNVTWLPPAGRENFVSEYEVTWRLTSTSADNGGGSSILSSTSVTISPGNLISGRAYTVTVTSRNFVAYTSRIQISSGQKEQALKPQTPGNIDYQSSNLDARDKTIQVVWIPSVGYVHQYEIELFEGNTQLATSTSSNIAYNQMKNGYRYNISITAVSEMFEGPNVVRSDPHTEEVKTVVQVPSSPDSVRCHTPTYVSLTVQWDAPLLPNGDLLAYNISTYTYPTSTLVKTETTGDLDLDFTVISLSPGFYYFFFVSTVNEQYQSAPARLTETYCATQAGVSDAPNNLAASVTQSRSFTVTWTEPTETHGEQFGYVMQVRTLNDQNLNICVLEVIRRCSDCVQTFTTSSLFNMCPADVSTEELVTQASLTGDVTQTDTVTGLDPDKEYSASVTAVNAAGRGNVTEILVQTEEEVPQKPYNIAISGITTESCTVAWDIDGPRPGDTTFFVIVNPTAPVTYDMIGLPGFEERTQSLNGLQAYWTYTVIIRATTSKGSTESEPTPFTTLPSAPGPVAAFEIITASPGEDYTKLKVKWKMPELLQRNSEIKKYILNHNTSENTMMTLDQNEDTTYTYQVELDVIPEDTYKISVYAVNEEDQNGEEVGAIITAPIADCGELADPINGVVSESDTQFEDIATYECGAGYVITGTTDPLFDRTCQVDGSWSGSAPTCSRRDCGSEISTISDGSAEPSSTTFESVLDVVCNNGYQNPTPVQVTCQSDGTWSSASCFKKDCQLPNVPSIVNAIGDDTTYQAVLTFECTNSNHVLVGSLAIKCLATGSWNATVPECKVKYDDACDDTPSCLTTGATCVEGTCQCSATGIVDLNSNICDTMPIIDNADDTSVSMDSGCIDPITFTPGFSVFGSTYTSVYICPSGYASLDSLYSDQTPPSATGTLATFTGFTILAPYYGNIDENSGQIEYWHSDITKNDGDDLERDDVTYVEEFIQNFGGKSNFQAAFILFVTWRDVKPFTGEGTATFQLVLVTDGTDTFALYIYKHGGMGWQSSPPQPNVWIGYHTRTEQYKQSLLSFLSLALAADQNALTKGVRGVTLHHLNSPDETPPTTVVNRIKCFRWYNDNAGASQANSQNLRKCPCDLTKLNVDPFFALPVDVQNIPDITCSTAYFNSSSSPHGKSCCYNRASNLWVNSGPNAGSFFQYHPTEFDVEHENHDLSGRRYCCEGSQLCSKYRELRPIGTCYTEPVSNIATTWGDPHFRTFDGKDFTFNGFGEFRMAELTKEGQQFKLQARTRRPRKPNGSLSQATVFSAYAVHAGDNAHFHVELNQNETGFTVYANNDDISRAIQADVFDYPPPKTTGGKMAIVKRGNTITVLFPTLDISLNISVSLGMFSMVCLMPTDLQGQTTGLLGNFNGDPADDFALPEGIMQSANMSEREIFGYASQWRVTEETSVFIYSKGKGHEDFHNASYTPMYLDEMDPDIVAAAELKCGEINVQCVFDFVFTEDEEVANQTKETEITSEIDKQEINSKFPSIEGCTHVNVDLQTEVVCKLQTDEASNNITINGLDDQSFQLDSNNTLKFSLDILKPIELVVIVQNTFRKKSQLVIPISVCTGCSGKGSCSTTAFREGYSDPFRVYQCICMTGYDGEDCEKDFDGCAAQPCSLLRNCTDRTPEDHVQNNTAFRCGACPDGYELTSNGKCKDINECEVDTDNCEQTCTNTEGGFECSCMPGYRIDTSDSSKCTDVNECDEALHQCEHVCENIDGDYTCLCRQGFVLDAADGQTCEQNDTDVCEDSEINCTQADGCTVEDGAASCFCNTGYTLTEDNICKDIDECSGSVCPQDCTNTEGSFTCECVTGYRLSGLTVCTACEFPTWGDNCGDACDCPDAIDCDPVKGCICQPGFTGIQCDDDIDECDTDVDLCQDVRKTCVNTVGSYVCACIDGYEIGPDQKCLDIDECSSPLLHTCHQKCDNVVGNYTCSCKEGFTQINTTHCDDVNECVLQTAGCDHICSNYEGGVNCFCEFGYILEDDRKTCIEDDNPCATANLACDVCITDLATMDLSCGCKPGFKLGADGTSCLDVQECEDPDLNKCQGDAVCVNERGSYRCECAIGYKLQRDQRTCSECDEFHYGIDCSETCSCLKGTCDNERGCICDEGWLGVDCDQDKDECQSTQNLCTGEHVECLNTPGSYKCQCKTGFQKNNGTCQDIDECSQIDGNNCDQTCTNTVGSFTCVCRPGFILQSEKCIDVDECATQNDCEQKCDNTVGSYRCSCIPGYNLDLQTRKSCTPVFACNSTQLEDCKNRNADCIMSEGEPECNCWKGYVYNNTTDSCEDIDECAGTPCDQECENTEGGYDCRCNSGFELDVDKVTCKVCDDGHYGENCSNVCVCEVANTLHCNVISGFCTCQAGWEGDTCDVDVDECVVEGSNACPQNSTCVDTDGSFVCNCESGFLKTSAGVCEVCQSFYFGDNCAETCVCNQTNTLACDSEFGVCDCKKGWESEDCSTDKDECNDSPDICDNVVNSACKNYPGTYTCECISGFYEEDGSCFDIDECLAALDECIQECENMEGSFDCNCRDGYSGDGDTCTECTGNTFGNNCSLACPCVADHSVTPQQSCDTVTGVCSCKVGWTGQNCEVDVNECENETLCTDVELSDCHNVDGGYSCDCYHGYTKNENDQCVEDSSGSTTTPAPNLVQISMEVVLYIVLPPGTNLLVGPTYNYYATGAHAALTAFYQTGTGILGLIITIDNLSAGSLIVDYTLTYPGDANTEQKLAMATVSLAKEANLVFYDQNVSSRLVVEGNATDECVIYEAVFGSCRQGFTCKVEYNETVCKEVAVDDNFALIIGVSAGGLVVVISVILLVLCMKVMREKRELIKTENKEKEKENAVMMEEPKAGNSLAADGDSVDMLDSTFDKAIPSNVSNGKSDWNPVRTWKSLARRFLDRDRDEGDYIRRQVHHQHADVFSLPRPLVSTFVPKILQGESTYPRNEHPEYGDSIKPDYF